MVKLTVSKKKITEQPKKFVRLVLTEDKPSWHRIVECADGTFEYRMGAGKWKSVTPRTFITLVRSIVRAAKAHQIEYLAIQLQDIQFSKLYEVYNEAWVTSTIAENLLLASYEFDRYKTKKAVTKQLKEIVICNEIKNVEKAGFDRGVIVGTYTNKIRSIANASGDDIYPELLALAAKETAKGLAVKVSVFNEAAIKKAKLHALWAVGKGAEHGPRFIVMEYYGAGKPTRTDKPSKKKQPIILIGKGVTYDTGGLNIKPSGSMHDMHLDMSGGSAVIGAICAAAKLKLKQNVIAIIPAAENAVSGHAMRAGDIINSHAGKSIEVIHTDAEGRLVLADGLSYAKQFNPKVVIDVATLTGASLIALGQHASAIMTKDSTLETLIRAHGEASGDYVWPLPLWDEYKQHLKSDRADIANIAPNFSRFGGTIEGGTFLSYFAPNCPWVHMDIAPRMASITQDKLAKGSTGEPVRLLVRFIEHYS